MNNEEKICPTCGQPIRRFTDKLFKRAAFGGIAGIVFGFIFASGFSLWWFGPGMHFTPMALIHYVAWSILFGFAGAAIGALIKR